MVSQPNADGKKADAASKGSSIKLDLACYEYRIGRLFEEWERSDLDVDCIVALSGKAAESPSRVGHLQMWLCGYMFPETVIFFIRKSRSLVVSSGPKKLSVLKQLSEVHKEDLALVERREGEDAILKALEAAVGEHHRLGIFAAKGEEAQGAFAEALDSKMLAVLAEWPRVPVDNFAARLLAPTDKFSAAFIEKSATVSCRLLKEAIMNAAVDILDQELQKTHASVVDNLEALLKDRRVISRWQAKFDVKMELVDFVYGLIDSQSSGFGLKPGQPASTENVSLKEGCICVAVAGKYADWTTNVGRTLLLDATSEEKDLYSSCLQVQEALIKAAKPGVVLADLFRVGAEACQSRKLPVPRTFGHSLSLEFRDAFFLISDRCQEKIQSDMVFNVVVTASGSLADGRSYGIHLADSVLITADGCKCLTASIKNDLKTVIYELKDDEENKPSTQGEPSKTPSPEEPLAGRPRISRRVAAQQHHLQHHEAMLDRQRNLRVQKFTELRDRFADGTGPTVAASSKKLRRMNTLHVYRDVSQFPKDLNPCRVFVDRANEALLVPVHGQHVPFHISTIRNAMHTLEDDATHSLRINFVLPGQGAVAGKEEVVFPEPSPSTVFLKELTVKTVDPSIHQVYKQIQEIQKIFKSRDVNTDIATQQQLQLNRSSRRILLKNLMFKTTGGVSGRRVIGSLEVHANGLRYTAARIDPIDITFSNVKHAFCQPAGKEFVVILHFHLRNAIMINKKRAIDVQFFTETGSQIDDLDSRRGRSHYDPDEVHEEEREQQRKTKVNQDFKHFVEQVQGVSPLRFELPIKDLAFYGIPGHNNIRIMPTLSALMSVVEWPVFVVSLEDLEIVSFERVMHGLRAFDMTIVFRDFSRPVRTITSVPVDSMDTIKKWLNEMDIVWYESKTPLNWPFILKTIRQDVEGFIREGGFSFLDDGGSEKDPQKATQLEDEDEEDEDYDESINGSLDAVTEESEEESEEEE
ncbi:MAG: hypothetical protein KVP17_003980, partial [Porospora cf. gigantea B]|uniref:uncharacterized protein n=2 Tax=Porospora cf. gigantea B TaxID=2853592 RepID=UPI003571BD1B